MDAALKAARKGRVGMSRTLDRGGASELIQETMSLKKYPEELDPKPIEWPYPYELSAEVPPLSFP